MGDRSLAARALDEAVNSAQDLPVGLGRAVFADGALVAVSASARLDANGLAEVDLTVIRRALDRILFDGLIARLVDMESKMEYRRPLSSSGHVTFRGIGPHGAEVSLMHGEHLAIARGPRIDLAADDQAGRRVVSAAAASASQGVGPEPLRREVAGVLVEIREEPEEWFVSAVRLEGSPPGREAEVVMVDSSTGQVLKSASREDKRSVRVWRFQKPDRGSPPWRDRGDAFVVTVHARPA